MKRSAKKVTPVGEENGAGNGCSDCNPVLANATQQPGRSGLRGMRNRLFFLKTQRSGLVIGDFEQ